MLLHVIRILYGTLYFGGTIFLGLLDLDYYLLFRKSRIFVLDSKVKSQLSLRQVGKGLSLDAKAQKLAFQHWIEAVSIFLFYFIVL